MKHLKRKLKKIKLIFTLLLLLVFYGNAKSQTIFTLFAYSDSNGDGLPDWNYITSNGYVGILHGIPQGTWPVGNQVNWSWYYCGVGFHLMAHGDMDGLGGNEIAVWQPTGTAIIVITDRLRDKFGYNTGGSSQLNTWTGCPNFFANFDGQPGHEIFIYYPYRSPSSKRGSMIIHRTRSRRATWSCTNLSSFNSSSSSGTLEANPNTIDEDVPESPDNQYTGTAVQFDRNPNLSPPEGWRNPANIGSITISPNPSTGLVKLTTDQPDEIIQQITITDVTGKAVLNSNLNIRTVDINKFSNGLYFIRVKTDKKSYIGKVLKE
jgi:hypothetical protein